MTVSETQIERGMKALHEISTYRGYNQETLDREWSRMEGIYRSQVTAILTAALSDQAGGWQADLENAPRDTAVWILLDGHPYIGFCETANWLNERDRWFAKSTFVRRGSSMDRRATPTTDDIYCCHGLDIKPSHWQPLPAPPPSSTAGESQSG